MKNPQIGRLEAEDLKRQVQKVLRGLGNPEPPLDLRMVRDLLKLDLQYYSSQDDSALREVVSRIKIAGKQLFMRPTLLVDAVKKASFSALLLPDRRRILLDSEVPELKHRWNEAHEIIHDLAPWHGRFLFGDDAETLNATCHEKIESEANYGAGQLLFLEERFRTEASDSLATLDTVRTLHGTFGNTITSTLWRFVEESHPGLPMVAIVSQHPFHPTRDFDPAKPCRYCVESPAFRARFGQMSETALFAVLRRYCSFKRRGPLGAGEMILTDRNGDRHVFFFESFSNTYDVLTLGVYVRPATQIVAVPAYAS